MHAPPACGRAGLASGDAAMLLRLKQPTPRHNTGLGDSQDSTKPQAEWKGKAQQQQEAWRGAHDSAQPDCVSQTLSGCHNQKPQQQPSWELLQGGSGGVAKEPWRGGEFRRGNRHRERRRERRSPCGSRVQQPPGQCSTPPAWLFPPFSGFSLCLQQCPECPD